jgi:hypothetical protein
MLKVQARTTMLEEFSYENVVFADGRGAYPERVKAVVPLGTRAKIKRIADKEAISTSEVIRRALASYLDRHDPQPSRAA